MLRHLHLQAIRRAGRKVFYETGLDSQDKGDKRGSMTKLQIRRKERGLSQSELADKADMSIRTLQSLESGTRDIRKVALDTALKLEKALECGIEDIIEEA